MTPALNKPLPEFEALATGGVKFTPQAFTGKIVVLYFYPKDNTPGCTTEAMQFRDHHKDFVKAGAVVFGVSRDNMASHDKFKQSLELPFELIADTEEKLCHMFGVVKNKIMYGKKVKGIERSTFLIDGTGMLRAEWRGLKVAGHVEEVLKAVKALKKAVRRTGPGAAAPWGLAALFHLVAGPRWRDIEAPAFLCIIFSCTRVVTRVATPVCPPSRTVDCAAFLFPSRTDRLHATAEAACQTSRPPRPRRLRIAGRPKPGKRTPRAAPPPSPPRRPCWTCSTPPPQAAPVIARVTAAGTRRPEAGARSPAGAPAQAARRTARRRCSCSTPTC